MKTLFVAYRVTDLENSLDFYTTLGYIEVSSVAGGDGGRLVLLKFPDEPVATPADP
jgi:lactoylglutathione lyase